MFNQNTRHSDTKIICWTKASLSFVTQKCKSVMQKWVYYAATNKDLEPKREVGDIKEWK